MRVPERPLSLRNLVLLVSLPLLVSSFAVAQRGTSTRRAIWHEYTYATQGFAITAPIAPNVAADAQSPEVTVYRWVFAADLRGAVHAGVRADCAQTLGRLQKPAAAAAVSAAKEIELNGHHGLETTGQTKTGQHYRERIYCAGDHAYSINSEWAANKAEPLALSRWFNSFRLMDVVAAPAATAPSVTTSKGVLAEGHTYTHPGIGLTLQLPGTWELKERNTAKTKDSGCRGPLCGAPEVDDVLNTEGKVLFVNAWKLAPAYRDRRRYRLEKFAKTMMTDSLVGSGWQPASQMGAVPIAGKPGYRLLVHKPAIAEATGFGIVSENNGYVFLIIGSTGSAADEATLQKAVEAAEFSGAVGK